MPTVSQSGYYNLQALTSLGTLGVGMRLYTYTQGTTNHKDAYTDAAGATPQTYTSDGAGGQYIALDSRGELPSPLYLAAGAYDLCLKTSAGATVWTRRADPIGADLAGSGGSASIGFLQAGTGAVARTAQAKMRDTVGVADYTGFDAAGATDSTAAVQAAVTYAESLSANGPVEIRFPPGAVVDLTMVFITTGRIKLNGNGCTIVQNHDATNSVTVGGAGQYKVSNAFMIKRGAANVEITGFNFTTDDASFPSYAAGYGSYFASIGAQHFNGLNIHHNTFAGGQRRALFVQAGKNLRFVDNKLTNNGFTIHVGFTLNQLFYDGSTSTTDKYSPAQVTVQRNIFDGYTSSDPSAVAHLTGPYDFAIDHNKFLGINQAASEVISIYCNDNGPYSSAGAALAEITGTCYGNTISGTFESGIAVKGYSAASHATWNASYVMDVDVSGNNIRGTGVGIFMERCAETKIHHNNVKVTGSPLSLNREISDCDIHHNKLVGLGAGTNLTTIYAPSNLAVLNLSINYNKIITPAADQYAIRATTAMDGLELIGNDWYFNAEVAACRLAVLTLTGVCNISENRLYVDTDVTGITAFILGGNSYAGVLTFSNNGTSLLAGTGAASFKAANFFDFLKVDCNSNQINGAYLIEDTTYSYFNDNRLLLGASNASTSADFNNTGRAAKGYVWVSGNYIEMPAALNNPGIRVISNNDATNNTLSKVTMNVVIGNSTGTLIQQTVHGVLETIGNTIVNNGSGGTTIGVSGSASNTAL